MNELTAKKKEADELALNQEKELERQREEARRLKAQMATLGGEKDSEQQKLLEELQVWIMLRVFLIIAHPHTKL